MGEGAGRRRGRVALATGTRPGPDQGRDRRGRPLPARRPAGHGGAEAFAREPVRSGGQGRRAVRLPAGLSLVRALRLARARGFRRRAAARSGHFRHFPAGRRHGEDAGPGQFLGDDDGLGAFRRSGQPGGRAAGRSGLRHRNHRRRLAGPSGRPGDPDAGARTHGRAGGRLSHPHAARGVRARRSGPRHGQRRRVRRSSGRRRPHRRSQRRATRDRSGGAADVSGGPGLVRGTCRPSGGAGAAGQRRRRL
uniref:PE-PGRS family protein n=1 Tax=Parastrongyloides trichosuri TaxID=131310 RepID=A0A0N4Z569_PARTI